MRLGSSHGGWVPGACYTQRDGRDPAGVIWRGQPGKHGAGLAGPTGTVACAGKTRTGTVIVQVGKGHSALGDEELIHVAALRTVVRRHDRSVSAAPAMSIIST